MEASIMFRNYATADDGTTYWLQVDGRFFQVWDDSHTFCEWDCRFPTLTVSNDKGEVLGMFRCVPDGTIMY